MPLVTPAMTVPSLTEDDDAAGGRWLIHHGHRHRRNIVRDHHRHRPASGPYARPWRGRRVTFALFNAMYLCSNEWGDLKAAAIAKMLGELDWPDIVVITEVGKPSGSIDLREFFGDAINAHYGITWTQRSVSLRGEAPNGKVGGGVAMLVRRRLWLKPREMKLDLLPDDVPYVDGHLRVWRLDPIPAPPGSKKPRSFAIQRPIIITAAYIPPADSSGWGNLVRPIVFQAIADSDEAIHTLRRSQDVFAVTMLHSNAPDGGVELQMSLDTDGRPDETIDATIHGLRGYPGQRRGGRVRLTSDGRRMLKRCYSLQQKTATSVEGVAFAQTSAKWGKLPTAGVVGHAQSTSWTNTALGHDCAECMAGRPIACLTVAAARARNALPGRKNQLQTRTCAELLGMRSVHDVMLVPDSLILDYIAAGPHGRRLLNVCTRRIGWASNIGAPQDHAVTYGHMFVAPEKVSVETALPPPADVGERLPRRYRPPDNLLQRHIELGSIADDTDARVSQLAAQVNRFVLLDDIDSLDSLITGANAAATQAAVDARDDNPDPERPTVKQLRRRVHDLRQDLQRLVGSLPFRRSDHSAPQKRRVKLAKRLLNQATKQLNTLVSSQHSARMSHNQARAPRRFWRDHATTDTDPGAPVLAADYLLDHQNDEKGNRVCSDRGKCKDNLRKNRADMYQPRSDAALGKACSDKLNAALIETHYANRDLLQAHPAMQNRASAAALSAKNPGAPMAAADAVHGLDRDLTAARRAVNALPDRPGAVVRTAVGYQQALASLNRDFDEMEVQLGCVAMDDVGPGPDGKAPVTMQQLQRHGATVSSVSTLYNMCLRTGCLPTAWREHRSLFCYKGKNADPYHPPNYRGLGIDNLLCKLWSQLLANRLDEFLRATNGLSRLQGGFQRQRGPPEQAFSLTASVRAAIGRRHVYIGFLDIVEAYDSCIHPMLWKRCLDKGIHGPFFAALQGIYHEAIARIDVLGELLPPVPLRRGVLQGNSLSTLLFNCYLDGVIEAIETAGHARGVGHSFGVPLPRYTGAPGQAPQPVEPNDGKRNQDDHLPGLFFADDGALLAFDVATLQAVMDLTVVELTAMGLTVSVKKTKWMLVPRLRTSPADYERLKRTALRAPLIVYGKPVELVDEFNYLGVLVWWGWDMTRAWKQAQDRARKCFFGALKGGWNLRAGSLSSQLAYARAKIFCHFNYISALAGAGGCRTDLDNSSAPWLGNRKVTGYVLRAISGQRQKIAGLTTALEIESGTWAQLARIDMLLLRMWCKFVVMPPDSTFYRAMCLSMDTTGVAARMWPEESNKNIDQLPSQTWAQQLYAAAARFGIPATLVDRMDPQMAALQIDAMGSGQWLPALASDPLPAHATSRLRLVIHPRWLYPPLSADHVYVEGVDCWPLPEGTTPLSALRSWTEPLKAATYAALKLLGNRCRQQVVRQFLADQVAEGTRLKTWASTIAGSFEQPYWRLDNTDRTRRMCALRLDLCPTEDFTRFRPSRGARPNPPDGSSAERPRIKQIVNPLQRACYNCESIDNVQGIYWPENLVHVLLRCPHPTLAQLRNVFRTSLRALLTDPGSLRLARDAGLLGPPPDPDDDDVLLTCMQLCIGAGPQPLLQQTPLPSALARTTRASTAVLALARRNAPQHTRKFATTLQTARWIRALCDDWCNIMRDARRRDPPHASPGCRLATLAATHALSVFSARRTLLRDNASYSSRSRDPLPGDATAAPARGHVHPLVPGTTHIFPNLWSSIASWPTTIAHEESILYGIAHFESLVRAASHPIPLPQTNAVPHA